MTKPEVGQDKNYSALIDKEGVVVQLPENASPYVPFTTLFNEKGITALVWDDELEIFTPRKFEWRDLLIMHKALTRMFGKKLRKNRKV